MKRSKHNVSYYQILLLILAGESVFILPFVLARIFRPTFLDVFELTNLQLGSCFSIYGIVALISYVYGGTLADKFAPRKLISISLILTAFGGLLMATSVKFDAKNHLWLLGVYDCFFILGSND